MADPVDVVGDGTVTLTGFHYIDMVFQQLTGKATRRVGRAMATAAGRPVRKAARALVPTDTHALKKSLGIKRLPFTAGGTVVGIMVGPRRKLVYDTPKGIRIPSKYHHLMEEGFTLRKRGKNREGRGYWGGQAKRQTPGTGEIIGRVPGTNYLTRALELSKQAAIDAMFKEAEKRFTEVFKNPKNLLPVESTV